MIWVLIESEEVYGYCPLRRDVAAVFTEKPTEELLKELFPQIKSPERLLKSLYSPSKKSGHHYDLEKYENKGKYYEYTY